MSSSLDDSLDVGSDEELAHSFRKRRLTYSKHHITDSAAAAAAALLADEEDSLVESDAEIQQRVAADDTSNTGDKRKRQDNSITSPPSKRIKPSSNLDDSLRKRILHAGEITKQSTQPHRTQPKNKWRQRFSFCSTTPDTALPFPRHVVGTYSCHGMEPVYDSDYDHDEDDEEEKNESVAKINQDRGGMAYPYAQSEKCALFSVYDGHGEGGEMVSQYALGEVQRLLEERLVVLTAGKSGKKLDVVDENGVVENDKEEVTCGDAEDEESLIRKAFIDTFIKVDRGLLRESDIEPMYSGTTACVALLRHNKLYIANAGDSRAVLAKRKDNNKNNKNNKTNNTPTENDSTNKSSTAPSTPELITIPLSIDQNPDSPGEKERILSAGGYVSPPPEPGLSARVWLDAQHTQIGLAMARSIGDHAVKNVGVIAEPVVTCHEVKDEDEFLILASDGVWEFMESEDAVKIVSKHLYADIDRNGGKNCASKACEALIKAAMDKWHEHEGDYRDDITAIVVRLRDIWNYH